MATHGVMIPSATTATKLDSLVRSAKASFDVDNGNVVLLNSGISATSGEGEVWTATKAATPVPTGLWMVGEPELVITNSQYKGLDPDPRKFYVASGEVFTVFKIKKYDVIRLIGNNFSNTRTTETYADIVAGQLTLTWSATETSATAFKLVEVTNIALSTGSPGNNRVVAYRLEAIGE